MKRRTDHYASYKDPSAKVFIDEEDPQHIYREIAPSYLEHYNFFQSSGLAAELLKKKWLIDFEEVAGEKLILKARKIPFVSYPYEWTFNQWKEAAMLTMKIQHQALKYGMILKDATPFNIVFDGATPVFVDVSSFETYKEGNPWQAFKQFSENLYMPLIIYKYFDAVANDLYLSNPAGIPLSKGLPLLPMRAHLSVNTILYLTLPARIRKKTSNTNSSAVKSSSFSQKNMQQFAEQLFSNIDKLKQSSKKTKWNDYYETGIADETYLDEKSKVLSDWTSEDYQKKSLIDHGCNTGNFSKLLAPHFNSIIAYDEDSRSTDELYIYCRQNKINNIFCFTGNLASPAPATGWNNEERPALVNRLKADVSMALALIHHLAISTYIRFEMMAKLFAELSNELIIEFVPPDDEKVQLILAGRQETFSWYNQDNFMKAFQLHFNFLKKNEFKNKRVLFHFIKKENAE